MDRLPLHFQPNVEKSLLGPPCFRNGTRCPSLGTDPLEYLEYGPVFTLDSGTGRECSSRTFIVAVAGSAGCYTGRR